MSRANRRADDVRRPTSRPALLFASLGYRVVPARPGSKIPLFKDWPNVATTDPEIIAGWDWSGGVCVVTGEASDLVVLDVDVKNGAPGRETLKHLLDELGIDKLPETPVVDTPSGGVHYWFRWPKGRKIQNDAGRKLGPGLDIRAGFAGRSSRRRRCVVVGRTGGTPLAHRGGSIRPKCRHGWST